MFYINLLQTVGHSEIPSINKRYLNPQIESFMNKLIDYACTMLCQHVILNGPVYM